MRRLRPGTHVRVSRWSAGIDSGRCGVIVSRQVVPTDGSGIPRLDQGHYKPLGPDDYAIRDGNGDLFTMNQRYLELLDENGI